MEGLAAGSSLAVRRPTPGVALLSLWIDAGARDGSPPQVATAAALWAAERASAEARVLPEGTELRVLCSRRLEGVEACARRLVAALAVEPPNDAQTARLRERVRATRVRAAADEGRHAQTLALHGLLGEAAKGLSPLGSAEDDANLTAAAVRDFLRLHYAPSRALLVGWGDVTRQELASANLARASGSPTPAARKARTLQLEAGSLHVELGRTNRIALVVPQASVAQAASLCERFREVHPSASASISMLQGGTLAHLDLPGGSAPYARLQAAVFDVTRLVREPEARAPVPPPDTLLGMSQALGEQWVARGASRLPSAAVMGIGLVLGHDPHAPGESDAALAKARERALQAIAAGQKNSEGVTRGDSSEERARVIGENGARIDVVRRRQEGWFAAAVRFAGGSALDPPTAHGRAALLASLMADGCGFSSERALDVRLLNMQATLSPLVDAEGIGVLVSAPMPHAEEALDTLLRCALRPTFSSRAVEDARVRMLKTLWGRESTLLHASLARAVAQAAPGRVAPWGTPEGVAKVDQGELRRLHAQRAVGPGVSVWVVADRPPAALARFVARRLSNLSDRAPKDVALPLPPQAEVDGTLVNHGPLRVVVGVRAAMGETGSEAPQVFAEALGEALSKRVGKELWAWGRGASGLSVAGVGLSLREEELDAVRAHTEAALKDIGQRPEQSFQERLETASMRRSMSLSSARGWVEAAFHGHDERKAISNADVATIRRLSAEKPAFYVLRPRP